MADKADDIRKELNKGRQDIADTRLAISEKLAILEDRVQETVDGVKHTFDLQYQVKERPWLMFGGSLLLGYTLGRRGNVPSTIADTSSEPSKHAQPQQNIASEVSNQVHNGLETIKGAAVGAVISMLWAMTKQVLLPPDRQIDGAVIKAAGDRVANTPQFNDRDTASTTNGRHEP